MAVINVIQPALQSAIITVILWLFFVSLAFVRLRKVPVETRMNEMPKMIILAFSAAIAGTLAITVAAAMFFPQFIEINLGTVYTAGLLGAAISLWWTFAVFWREIKTVQNLATETEPKTIAPPAPQRVQIPQQTGTPQQVQIILGADELQRILDRIVIDRKMVEEVERKDKRDQQNLAQELSNLAYSISALRRKYDPAWDSDLRGQVIIIHKQLDGSGSAMRQGDFDKARECFNTSYQVAVHLKYDLESKNKGQGTKMVRGMDELLPALREWMTRWEQYEGLDHQQRWQMVSQGEIQRLANELSGRLVNLDSKYAESWDDGMRNKVRIVSSDLQKLGLRQLNILAGDKALQDMEDLGKSAHEKSRALVSLLATR